MRKAGKQERSAPPPDLLFVWSNGRSSELLFLKRKAGKADEWPATRFFLPVFVIDLSGPAQLY